MELDPEETLALLARVSPQVGVFDLFRRRRTITRISQLSAITVLCAVLLNAANSAAAASIIMYLSADLDFGKVSLGESVTRYMEIRNSSTSTDWLTVTGFSCPECFTVSGGTGTIPRGGKLVASVRFKPADARFYNGVIMVDSNATGGNGPLHNCSGTGVMAGELQLSGDLAFGNVLVGQPVTRMLTISNVNDDWWLDVTGFYYPTSQCFSGDDWEFSIEPRGSRDVPVTFTPTAAGYYSGTVRVWSNTAFHPENTKECSGTGVVGYTLTVNAIGASGVRITGSPTECGGTTDYTTSIASGTMVTLTAPTTSGDKTFTEWTGDVPSTNSSITFSMTGNTSVTANYNGPPGYTLTVNSSGASGVSISSSTSHGGNTPYAMTLPGGTPVTLTAPPTAGGKPFTGWTGAVPSSNTTITVSMDGNKSVIANYGIVPPPPYYTLTVNSTPGGHVVSPGEDKSFSYDEGTWVELRAEADPGYKFIGWSGLSSTSNPFSLTMSQDYVIAAKFQKITEDPTKPEIRLSGRVRNGRSGAALANVRVDAGGQTVSTDGQGNYLFSRLEHTSTISLTGSKTGYATYKADLKPAAGALSLVHDFEMFPCSTGKPVITGLTSRYNGMFLAGLPLLNEYTATVTWSGSPGTVEFYANNTLKTTVSGKSTGGKATFDMGKDFTGAFGASANKVRVRAKNAEGAVSDWSEKPVVVLPLPTALLGLLYQVTVHPTGAIEIQSVIDFPEPPMRHFLNLPVIGKFGVEVASELALNYELQSGEWELTLGRSKTGQNKLNLWLGTKEVSGWAKGGVQGTATPSRGITLDEVAGSLGISTKFQLAKVGILDIVGPGISKALSMIPGLGKVLKNITIEITAEPELEGEATFGWDPKFTFKELNVNGDIGIEAAYQPDLGICKATFLVGGKPGVTFGIPVPLFKQVRFEAYASAEFIWKAIPFGPYKYIFIEVTYPQSKVKTLRAFAIPSSEDQTHRFDRSYLNDGLARFVPYDRAEQQRGQISILQSSIKATIPLQQFRAMIDSRAPGMRLGGTTAEFRGPVQADLPLIENTFPESEAALASHVNELMLLYVSDNGSPGDLQFTDINWTRFDGTDWSEPVAIQTDTRAEFAPRVAFDGNGDAVAVWERVKDPNFVTVDITAMASQMEIVWSRWDRSSSQWSEPSSMTDNDYFDHTPRLCGPMSDGSLLLVWTENRRNLLIGDVNSPDTVLWSRWDSTLHNWSSPLPLVDGLICRQSESLAGAGLYGAYVWAQDLDGDMSDPNDQELFLCQWTGQVWSVPTRLTNDTLPDRNVRVAVAEPNDLYIVWQRGANLLMTHNFGDTSVVRADSQTVSFADYAMTLGPNGNLALVWEEQSDTGPDAFYSVYDPASSHWSKDNRFFADSAMEKSFAPVWDAAGNLTVAYNRVEINKTSEIVVLPDGSIAEVDNIPTPGRVDLAVFKHRLAVDLGFQVGDFTADGDDYLPGGNVILCAKVRNVGDLSARDIRVAFYDGDPAAGGIEIGRQTIVDWIEGGGSGQVEFVWHVPEPPKRYTIFAVIDPNQQVQEGDRSNNQLSIVLGGTDLSVALASASGASDGSARIIVRVSNRGAPTAPANTLAVRPADQPSATPLMMSTVPQLAPRQTAELALDLPAAALRPGEICLAVRVDDASEVNDIDLKNNQVVVYVSCPEPLAPLPSPIAHWAFDDAGQFTRESVAGGSARVYGATSTAGVMGNALSFDGSDDYVDCGEANRFAPEKLTVSLWVSPEKSFASNQYLAARCMESASERDYALALRSDSRVEFSFGEGATSCVSFRSNGLVPLGEWTFVVAARNGMQASIYLNGELDNSVSYAFVPHNKGQDLKIGAGARAPWGFFKGKIDDVRIYDSALTTEEVLRLYQDVSP